MSDLTRKALAEVIHDAMPDTDNWRDYFARIDEPDGWSLEIRRTLSERLANAILAALSDSGAEPPKAQPFRVTDDLLDAPDGTVMTFRRVGRSWEPEPEPAPKPSGDLGENHFISELEATDD